MATRYNIEQGLKQVEQWLEHDPKNAWLHDHIERWRALLVKLSTDGPVCLLIRLDAYVWAELQIPDSPLQEMRSLAQYRQWMMIERYTQDHHHTRFFDLCKVS